MQELSNLPRFFELVARSLNQPVITAEDTIGGCSLWSHAPSTLAASCGPGARFCNVTEGHTVAASNGCTCKSNQVSKEFPRVSGPMAGSDAIGALKPTQCTQAVLVLPSRLSELLLSLPHWGR